MSDVVARSGVPFGSLYQYFPDKTAIIGTLAERYNAVGRDCVRRDLAVVKTARDLHPALCRITDSYYQMFIDVPVMRDIWQATQADRSLQKLDEEDGVYLAGLLGGALRRIAPEAARNRPRLVFPTDHDADRRDRPPRHHAGREASCPHAHSVQADAAEESGRTGNVVRKPSRLTARTPPHRPGSSSTSAGAGMQ
jgi:AcrR family transcriptional regulator